MAKKRLHVVIDTKAHQIIERYKVDHQLRAKDDAVEKIIIEWDKIKNG